MTGGGGLNRTQAPDGQADLTTRLHAALDAAGFVHRFADVSVAAELTEILADLRDSGEVSESLLAEYRESLSFSCPDEVGQAGVLIVVASPSPVVKVRFQLDSGPFEAVIPSTYISSDSRERALEAMGSVLGPLGFTVARARVPVKLLAVRTGLAQYGRNNIAYVRNIGSFVRLDAFCTDAPLQIQDHKTKASWRMSGCPPCRNCHHVCPTQCIPYDGKVIDAHRCLTYLNEHEGEWPDWLDPRGHNSLVGCTRCQELCPMDRVHLRIPRVVAEFDREETEWVIKDLPAERLPSGVRAKLAALDLEVYSAVLGRNLRALVAAAGRDC
jgi:epoxyqueuosine reductase